MIDVSSWRSFKISDLFVVSRGQRHVVGNHEDGNLPYYSASLDNNGVTDYISNPLFVDKDAVVVTTFGDAFYAKGDFTASDEITILHHIKMSELSGLFIVSAIRRNKWKYSFKVKAFKERVSNDSISLPVASDGQPDWDYMESYMKAVMEESEKALSNLKKADDTKHLIDVSGWGEFSCKELFECKNTGNILVRDVIDGSGDTPYVTASGYNNGIVAHIDASNYEIIKGHCILVGGKTFTITYQKDDFVSNDSHNFTIRVKDYDISDLDYLYLVSMIYVYFGQKYSWNDAVTKDKLLDEIIPLPITSTGEPDWQYMEDYMRNIMDKSEKTISELQIKE